MKTIDIENLMIAEHRVRDCAKLLQDLIEKKAGPRKDLKIIVDKLSRAIDWLNAMKAMSDKLIPDPKIPPEPEDKY